MRAGVGDDLHHGPKGSSRDVRQGRRDHAEEKRDHDEAAHRPQHAQTAPHQSARHRLALSGRFGQFSPPLPGDARASNSSESGCGKRPSNVGRRATSLIGRHGRPVHGTERLAGDPVSRRLEQFTKLGFAAAQTIRTPAQADDAVPCRPQHGCHGLRVDGTNCPALIPDRRAAIGDVFWFRLILVLLSMFLTFSGHGAEEPARAATAACRLSEPTWSLGDGSLFFDDLHECFARLAAGVKLLVVSDSCRSGSPIGQIVEERRNRFMRTYRDSCVTRVDADVILFSACESNEDANPALAAGKGSLFIETLNAVWREGKEASLESFAREVKARVRTASENLPWKQSPRLNCVNDQCDPAFLSSRPFFF